MYECMICKRYARRTLAAILRHIGEVHKFFEGAVKCGIEGCSSTARSYDSLRQHMYKKHKDILKLNFEDTTAAAPDDSNAEEAVPYDENEEFEEDDSNVDKITEPHPSFEAAKFILKTRDGKKITQTTLDGVLQDTKTFIQYSVGQLEQEVVRKLEHFEVQSEALSNIKELFSSIRFTNPFEDLETERKQENFFRRHFNYVLPTERVLKRSYRLANGEMKEVKDCVYDVSLIDSLQALLSCDSVRDQVFNSHQQVAGKMGDYCDSRQYRDSEIFQQDPCTLQIALYYDELEVCNPLGSKAKIHKLGIFYYMLGNIDPKFRSRLHTIQLIAVVRSQLLQYHPISDILEPFMANIRQLESDAGVPFQIDGDTINLHGTLTIVSADNPAANLIGGYKSLTSAFRKCRTCMATESDMRTKFHENEFTLRSREMYNSHCSDLGGPLNEHIATTYGITSNSILNTSRYFHVVDGIIPDIMHDILEGCLQLHMKWLLRQLIVVDKLFPLETFNSRLKSFNYGRANASNKPTCISQDILTSSGNTVKQSSSQAWCLGRYLPLLVGDLVDEDNEYWKNYLELLKIMELIFAPVTSDDKLDYLQLLIQDYLTGFVRLYPERPLVPKMHYLIHMPSWMKKCGPLVKYWCMRYEAKHKTFKKTAQVTGNFKNIAKTVAFRHQRYMCYKMTCSVDFLEDDNSYGKGSRHVVNDLAYATSVLHLTDLESSSEIDRVSYAEINGTKYTRGDVLLLCTCFDDDEPVFGKVSDIIVTLAGKCYFVLEPLCVRRFNFHYNAYEVEKIPNECVICQHKDFLDHYVLSTSKSFSHCLSNVNFVCIKYHVS